MNKKSSKKNLTKGASQKKISMGATKKKIVQKNVKKEQVSAKTAEKKKPKTVQKSSTKSKKQEVVMSKQIKISEKKTPTLLHKNSMKVMPSEVQKPPALIATPTDVMLKPFRDAAKRTQLIIKEKQKTKKRSNFIAKPQKSAKKAHVDLRVHTPASEGYLTTGGVDPASAMLRLAKAKGLDMIAVTDYHSAEFVDIVKSRARETDVKILPGLDLRCAIGNCDEVHLVALFPENYGSGELNDVLNKLSIPTHKRGRKNYCIEKPVTHVIAVIEENGGVIIPSRLDITPHKMKTLHELIDTFGFHVFDLAHPDNPEYFKQHWPDGEFTFVSFSNANALGQIGARSNPIKIPEVGFQGIKHLATRR